MECEEKVKWVLETFFMSTQIDTLYCDCQMNISVCHFQRSAYEDFCQLSMGKIEAFLKDLFTKESGEHHNPYTYYLNNNLACCISVLIKGEKCRGAIITQPVIISPFEKENLNLEYATLCPKERDACIAAISRVPIISQNRIMPIANTLNALAQQISIPTEVKLVGKSERHPSKRPRRSIKQQVQPVQSSDIRGHATYLQLKNAISSGNTEILLSVFDDFDYVLVEQTDSDNTMRCVKNQMIQCCALCSSFATEAQAPYIKTWDFTQQVVREIENTNNIKELYGLTRDALKTFTRYVAVSHMSGYSRYVRQVSEYIDQHYMDTITLEKLSQVAGCSKFHLSTLIKNNTGFGVTDIVNRVRVEKSKKLLMTSAISLAEVATAVGFSNRNYFSKVFKKHTGITPAAFSRVSDHTKDKEAKSKDILGGLLEQLFHMQEIFPGIYDVGRIVDPIFNQAWVMNPSGKILEDTCYDFWSKKQSCGTCIAQMALKDNKVFTKLEKRSCNTFFVLASPIIMGETKFVVELMKEVEDGFLNCTEREQSEVVKLR